jgi:hypothetical protein
MNTLKIAKDLQNAGLDAKAAEAISLSIHDSIESKACTKEDLLRTEIALKEDIHNLETRLIEEIHNMDKNHKEYVNKSFLLVCTFLGSLLAVLIFYAEWRFFK